MQTAPSVAHFFPDLAGKVALVTGGAGGLGSAICRVLAESGATVVAADVRADSAEALATLLRTEGLNAEGRAVDLRDAGATEAMVASVARDLGGLDILINNAGTDVTEPIGVLSIGDWDRVLDVNLRAPFVLSRAALTEMQARRSGHIVNIVSTAAKRAWTNATAYHASKWGLLGFSHALHTEARLVGVKVRAIVAGGMRTPFIMDRFPDTDPGVLQDPMNVANTIRFVLSQPAETVIPEVMVLPMRETSWP